MACSKYILVNTGTTIVTFNYQRCDDALWEYQTELLPGETKQIWLLNNTYSTAFSSSINLTNLGAFPFTSPTPTPSVTASQTPTPTPTPSVTTTATPTPTETETPTPTPTLTQTPTQTFAWYTYTLGSGATANDACLAFSASPQTIYGTVSGGPGPNAGEFLYETAGIPLTDAVPDGYYSNGTAVYTVTGGNGEITDSNPSGCA